ncbi:MAG: DUF542 domain-containing protein [Bacillota bacterium]|nr:DUF542 domain-containing protein [Bacillota bacterium]
MINIDTRIEEIVKIDNKMMDFFNDQKIDFCCQGYKTIKEVAEDKAINPSKLLDLIGENIDLASKKEEAAAVDLEEFKAMTMEEMIDSIIIDHHQRERDLLFEIDPVLNKIFSVHYSHHGQELLKLHSLFADLKKELEEHFVKEEEVTFPLMLANKNPSQAIIKKVEDLETDHEKAGQIIKEMIDLTDWFKVPEDGCNTYSYTFELLEKLVKDVFVHIFKENSILFEKYKESGEK